MKIVNLSQFDEHIKDIIKNYPNTGGFNACSKFYMVLLPIVLLINTIFAFIIRNDIVDFFTNLGIDKTDKIKLALASVITVILILFVNVIIYEILHALPFPKFLKNAIIVVDLPRTVSISYD